MRRGGHEASEAAVGKPEKQKEQKAEKRPLSANLADWIVGIALDAVKHKWDGQIWEPNK